jgi:hypothetical protein
VLVTQLVVNLPVLRIRNVKICEGDGYIVGGVVRTVAGSYYDTMTSYKGCDSVLQINIALVPLSATTYANVDICEGDLWEGEIYTEDTFVSVHLRNINGCDSVHVSRIYFHQKPKVSAGEDQVVNQGETAICIASGAMWVDMQATGVDVLISAPQKGWSGSPCCAMVMLSEHARHVIESTQSTSFACDLKKWLQIMESYEKGSHSYHTTMPTDALTRLREVMLETQLYGFEKVRQEQIELGSRVRALLESRGIVSVAAEGFKAPGVVVSYTSDADIQSSKKFLAIGLQTAAGVPLQCDEPADFMTFRIGLFGLEKLHNIDQTLEHLSTALDQLGFAQKIAVAA